MDSDERIKIEAILLLAQKKADAAIKGVGDLNDYEIEQLEGAKMGLKLALDTIAEVCD